MFKGVRTSFNLGIKYLTNDKILMICLSHNNKTNHPISNNSHKNWTPDRWRKVYVFCYELHSNDTLATDIKIYIG